MCAGREMALAAANLLPLRYPIPKKTLISLQSRQNRCKLSLDSHTFPGLIRCCATDSNNGTVGSESKTLKTCRNCKTQFDPLLNHPRACQFHTAHFGGETRRKFESVYTGGTMDTPDSGKVFQYWHCCGSEDPFDPGCTAAPHTSYDD